jgi:hypothetical protein
LPAKAESRSRKDTTPVGAPPEEKEDDEEAEEEDATT